MKTKDEIMTHLLSFIRNLANALRCKKSKIPKYKSTNQPKQTIQIFSLKQQTRKLSKPIFILPDQVLLPTLKLQNITEETTRKDTKDDLL